MPGEKITAVIRLILKLQGSLSDHGNEERYCKKKKITSRVCMNVRKTGLAAITLKDDDELIEVKFTDNNKEIILVTKYGQCIRFNETDVRSNRT